MDKGRNIPENLRRLIIQKNIKIKRLQKEIERLNRRLEIQDHLDILYPPEK